MEKLGLLLSFSLVVVSLSAPLHRQVALIEELLEDAYKSNKGATIMINTSPLLKVDQRGGRDYVWPMEVSMQEKILRNLTSNYFNHFCKQELLHPTEDGIRKIGDRNHGGLSDTVWVKMRRPGEEVLMQRASTRDLFGSALSIIGNILSQIKLPRTSSLNTILHYFVSIAWKFMQRPAGEPLQISRSKSMAVLLQFLQLFQPFSQPYIQPFLARLGIKDVQNFTQIVDYMHTHRKEFLGNVSSMLHSASQELLKQGDSNNGKFLQYLADTLAGKIQIHEKKHLRNFIMRYLFRKVENNLFPIDQEQSGEIDVLFRKFATIFPTIINFLNESVNKPKEEVMILRKRLREEMIDWMMEMLVIINKLTRNVDLSELNKIHNIPFYRAKGKN